MFIDISQIFTRRSKNKSQKWTINNPTSGARAGFEPRILVAKGRYGTALLALPTNQKRYKMDNNSERGEDGIRNLFLGRPRPMFYRSANVLSTRLADLLFS